MIRVGFLFLLILVKYNMNLLDRNIVNVDYGLFPDESTLILNSIQNLK